MFLGGMAWLTTRIKHAMAKGEGYGDHPNETLAQIDHSNLPSFGTAIIPVIAVIVVNFVLSKVVFVAANADKYAYLEGEPYNTALTSVAGTWALVIALIVGIILVIIFNAKRFKKGIVETLKEGVSGSFLAVMNTASEVGYGNVVKTLAGYEILAHAMLALSAGNHWLVVRFLHLFLPVLLVLLPVVCLSLLQHSQKHSANRPKQWVSATKYCIE